MSYLVLARKWRPKNFVETVGQEHVLKALTNALETQRLHHAYLFAGTRGVGKTTIARILAKALNCESGVTASPCGECGACREINEGRFVDLIEVDAASKTKVEDTRELLDNVQFAPAVGRYKVYLIDEVHMLTKHSFNALLKTLEEPPPHVKFLLATTDPQKLPVTVLSRCLQFNLKRLTPKLIRDRLQYICGEEDIEAESAALAMMARAADGSMRDALSLLDQAIAFCGGNVVEDAVASMLGTIDRQHVSQLLNFLADRDAPGLMAAIAEVDQQFPDYAQLLDDIARILQRIAVYQVVGPSEVEEDLSAEDLSHFADVIAAEDVQLFYQTAILGRRDLHLAPDPRSGTEMTLLRMLAFQPPQSGERAATPARIPSASAAPVPQTKKSAPEPVVAPPAISIHEEKKAQPVAEDDWADLIKTLGLSGATKLLANNCAMLRREGNIIFLDLDSRSESLLTPQRQQALGEALSSHFAETLRVDISLGHAKKETPVQEEVRRGDEALQAARQSLESDPNVQTLKDMFGATLNTDSVQILNEQSSGSQE
ncbi:MAG: DNA polymerase III subunit gamma/tau [Gammaproteobacteria bacterium]|nr:DNA polymerase III subunit gamma/tau [Gammaproteobacteria bacterium]